MWRSPTRIATGKATASANVAPRPTTTAVTCRKIETL
jgi:hypothetical protein